MSTWKKSTSPRSARALKQLVLAADLMRSDVRPLTPEDTLIGPGTFVENDLLALPVVDDLEGRRVIGHGATIRDCQRLFASRARAGDAGDVTASFLPRNHL